MIIRTAKFRHGSGADVESPTIRKRIEQEQRLQADKKLFEKRYAHLMLMLITAPDKSWQRSKEAKISTEWDTFLHLKFAKKEPKEMLKNPLKKYYSTVK